MMTSTPTVTRDQIGSDLRQLGIAPDDILLVHSSLSALGRVEGGADAVIDAILDVLGAKGTLLMPSFPGGGEHQLIRNGFIFDVRTAQSEMGLISRPFVAGPARFARSTRRTPLPVWLSHGRTVERT